MRTKRPMVGWFDPPQLVQTAFRVLISTLFGEFSDKREALAAANPISDKRLDPSFDYASRHETGDFWFDYVADSGDGWNSTFAIARLLAADCLSPLGAEEPLPRGRILVMGGDEVYPTPSLREYDDRLIYPFDEAYHPSGGSEAWPNTQRPDLYAVPGNHDWYDGLRTFFHLFCRRTIHQPGFAGVDRPGRRIGGRETQQTRSYFALKLPHGWWLWGTDSQLEGYIDQPQIDFFQFVATHWMEPGSRLILCTGTPDWQYVEPKQTESFSSFSYLSRLAPAVEGKGHRLALVLSGDSHHYVRYQEDGLDHITCGGGGAFLHPTHKLTPKSFHFEFPKPGEPFDPRHGPYARHFTIARKTGSTDEALFPDRATSRRLTAGNIAFALRNWKFTATLAGLYCFFLWLLDFAAQLKGDPSLAATLARGGFAEALASFFGLSFFSPWTAALVAAAFAGFYYFADAKGWRRIGLGAVHAGLQAGAIALVTCGLARLPGAAPAGVLEIAAWLLCAGAVCAMASATLVGLYLWACLSVLGIHWGHFSSLAIENWKSFLRLRIDSGGGLHVYPVGLARVPRDRGRSGPLAALAPELIEEPLVIR